MKNRTDNQCWRRWKILSKRSKNIKALNEQRQLEIIGVENIKINMAKPFKIQNKKQKREDIRAFRDEPINQLNEDKEEFIKGSKGEPKKPKRKRALKGTNKKSTISNGDSETVEDFDL